MTTRFKDLPPEQQQAIKQLVDKAPALTERQRERLQLLFRAEQAEQQDGAP